MGAKIIIPEDSPFTIHNIPFGVISTAENDASRCAVAIGNFAIDLVELAKASRLDHLELQPSAEDIFSKSSLNAFAALPRAVRQRVRESLISDITNDNIPEQCLVELGAVNMHLPFEIGGYSDFYCSLEHVQNCSGTMAADAVIPENWFYAPSVYNSRASSVVPSGHPIRRPRGVYYGSDGKPTYGPSRELDYELEMGVLVSKPIPYGEELDIENVEEHIFGFVLLNDWSSRDLQLFEMKPLGPFHGKGDGKKINLGTSNLRYLYWTPFQQLTHHASAMCGLKTGDLVGTGTISGDAVDDEARKCELGCLYEATQAGKKEAEFSGGFIIKYLQDGDEIVLKGHCGIREGSGSSMRLGFGECRGKIMLAFK